MATNLSHAERAARALPCLRAGDDDCIHRTRVTPTMILCGTCRLRPAVEREITQGIDEAVSANDGEWDRWTDEEIPAAIAQGKEILDAQ